MSFLQNVALRHLPGFIAGFAVAFALASLTLGDRTTDRLPTQSPAQSPGDAARQTPAPAITARAEQQRSPTDASRRIAPSTSGETPNAPAGPAQQPRPAAGRAPSRFNWSDITRLAASDKTPSEQIFDNSQRLAEEIAGNVQAVRELSRRIEVAASADPEALEAYLAVSQRLPESDQDAIIGTLINNPNADVRERAIEFLAQTDGASADNRQNLTDLIARETSAQVLMGALRAAEVLGTGSQSSDLRRAVEQQATNAPNPDVRRAALIARGRMGRADNTLQYLIDDALRSRDDADILAGLEAAQAAINGAPPDEASRLRATFASIAENIANDRSNPAHLRAAALSLTE